MKENGWGGRRKGAGRPKTGSKRKQRALEFSDWEWETLKRKAAEAGLPPRAYIYGLAEKDGTPAVGNPAED